MRLPGAEWKPLPSGCHDGPRLRCDAAPNGNKVTRTVRHLEHLVVGGAGERPLMLGTAAAVQAAELAAG